MSNDERSSIDGPGGPVAVRELHGAAGIPHDGAHRIGKRTGLQRLGDPVDQTLGDIPQECAIEGHPGAGKVDGEGGAVAGKDNDAVEGLPEGLS